MQTQTQSLGMNFTSSSSKNPVIFFLKMTEQSSVKAVNSLNKWSFPGATRKTQCNYISIYEHSGLLWCDAVPLSKRFSPQRNVTFSLKGPRSMTHKLLTFDKEDKLSSKTSGTTYVTAAHHIPKNHNPRLHCLLAFHKTTNATRLHATCYSESK